MAAAQLTLPADFWARVEPIGVPLHSASCYSTHLKADLSPGTFDLLRGSSGSTATSNAEGADDTTVVVARIGKAVERSPLFSVEVNIFRKISEVLPGAGKNGGGDGNFVRPKKIVDNHLCHIPEVIQTTEVRIVLMAKIVSIAFVFTEEALKDTANLYFICQGMMIAFLLRYRADWTTRGEQATH